MNIKHNINTQYLEFFDSQQIYSRERPESIDDITAVLELQNRCGSPIQWDENCPFNLSQKEYVATIPNGCVGEEGALYDENNIYVLNDIYSSKVSNLSPANNYDELVTIVQKWGYGYYHWMAECFPRLLQFLKDTNKRNVKILTWDTAFVRQYLNLIGIEDEQIIPFQTNHTYKAKKLYVPTPIYCGNPHKNSLLSIRNTFKQYFKPNEERINILISREGLPKRTLKHFNNLYSTLCKEFPQNKWVIFDKLSVKETIELFSKADLVVAVHGAGLTNTVFSPPDCKVVEIIPSKNCVNVCHWHTISSLGLDYRMIAVDFINPISQIEVDFNKVIQSIKSF